MSWCHQTWSALFLSQSPLNWWLLSSTFWGTLSCSEDCKEKKISPVENWAVCITPWWAVRFIDNTCLQQKSSLKKDYFPWLDCEDSLSSIDSGKEPLFFGFFFFLLSRKIRTGFGCQILMWGGRCICKGRARRRCLKEVAGRPYKLLFFQRKSKVLSRPNKKKSFPSARNNLVSVHHQRCIWRIGLFTGSLLLFTSEWVICFCDQSGWFEDKNFKIMHHP